MPPSADELLQYVINNGMIDLPNIEKQINMKTQQLYLSKHKYSIWENKNHQWCTYLPKDGANNNRMLYKRKTREQINDLIINYYKEQEANPTVDDIFKEYNDHRRELKKVSESTIWRDTKRYQRYFSSFGKLKIKSIDEIAIEDFLEKQIAEFNLTSKEFTSIKGIVRGIFQRAKKLKLTNINIVTVLSNLDVSDHRFRPTIVDDEKEIFFDDEMQKIIEYCYNNPRAVNTGIALLFATGLRIGELATLKKSDFNGLTFKVQRTETRYQDPNTKKYVYGIKEFPKTKAGYRTVVIPRSFEWILDRIDFNDNESEFIFHNKGNRLRTEAYAVQIRRLNKKLGITQKSAHKIRKTYCSILLDNKVDTKLIQNQVGHADISVTENFYHRNRKTLDKKIDIISAIPEFAINGYQSNCSRIQ